MQWAKVLPALLIIAIIVIFIGIYVSDTVRKNAPESSGGGANDGPGGRSAHLTDAALEPVLADNDVLQMASQQGRHIDVLNIAPLNSSRKGFLNYSGELTGVWIDIANDQGIAPYHYYFIVDAEKGRVLDKAGWLDLPPGDEVTISPGAAWYVLTGITREGWVSGSPTQIKASYSPEDAHVRQLIVDREGLDVLRNMSGRDPLEDVNISAYECGYNGTFSGISPPGSGWTVDVGTPSANASGVTQIEWNASANNPDKECYLVLINMDKNMEVNLTIWGSFGALPYNG